jgi:hypothetical protein
MGLWRDEEERSRPGEVAGFKADAYRRSGADLFVESDTHLAQEIAELSKKPVLCPAAGKIFPVA